MIALLRTYLRPYRGPLLLVVTLLTHRLAERLRANPKVSRGLSRLAGLFMIGFGLKLVVR